MTNLKRDLDALQKSLIQTDLAMDALLLAKGRSPLARDSYDALAKARRHILGNIKHHKDVLVMVKGEK